MTFFNRLRAGPVPWHSLLFAATVVLTLWFETGISPYAVARSMVVVVLLAAVLTMLAALAARSLTIGGLIATGVIGVLWSKQLFSLADIALSRMGVALAVIWIGLIAVTLFVVWRLVSRSVRSWTVAGTTRFLNRAAVALALATVLLGFLNGRLGEAIADLEQGGVSQDQIARMMGGNAAKLFGLESL